LVWGGLRLTGPPSTSSHTTHLQCRSRRRASVPGEGVGGRVGRAARIARTALAQPAGDRAFKPSNHYTTPHPPHLGRARRGDQLLEFGGAVGRRAPAAGERSQARGHGGARGPCRGDTFTGRAPRAALE
jgi:hypothetical protein